MRTIFKYPIKIVDSQRLELPAGAEILKACLDPKGNPCIYAELDTEIVSTSMWTIFVIGTGNPFPESSWKLEYISSFPMEALPIMWHVYKTRGIA